MGTLVPANVPNLLRPWTDVDVPQAPTPAANDGQNLRDLAGEAAGFFKSFGGKSAANPDAPTYQSSPPWVEPPPGFESFFTPGIIPTPVNNGIDTTVLTINVPPGWDGVIKQIATYYTGAGFVAGSGNLIWRVLRNGQAVKNFDSITVALGGFSGGGVIPLDIAGIRIFSGDAITVVVNHAVASGLGILGTSIIAFLGGYEWPK